MAPKSVASTMKILWWLKKQKPNTKTAYLKKKNRRKLVLTQFRSL